MGLVSQRSEERLPLLALVSRMGRPNPPSSDRLQRGDDDLPARDVIANPQRSCGYVLLRMGWPIADRDQLSGRLVGRFRWRPLWQWPHLLWDQAGRRSGNWRPIILHPLFLFRVRPAPFARSLHLVLLRE